MILDRLHTLFAVCPVSNDCLKLGVPGLCGYI